MTPLLQTSATHWPLNQHPLDCQHYSGMLCMIVLMVVFLQLTLYALTAHAGPSFAPYPTIKTLNLFGTSQHKSVRNPELHLHT